MQRGEASVTTGITPTCCTHGLRTNAGRSVAAYSISKATYWITDWRSISTTTESPVLKVASSRRGPLIHIHSGKSSSPDAFVSVQYRNHWFWIDDKDLASKHVFALIMMLFTMIDTGPQENQQVLTIPVQ